MKPPLSVPRRLDAKPQGGVLTLKECRELAMKRRHKTPPKDEGFPPIPFIGIIGGC